MIRRFKSFDKTKPEAFSEKLCRKAINKQIEPQAKGFHPCRGFGR